jgi:hypothetical protein
MPPKQAKTKQDKNDPRVTMITSHDNYEIYKTSVKTAVWKIILYEGLIITISG